ncbi:hypothetical protein RJ55_02092 [Drechmeria coniospora]|nr:hypothetical protein RJ55_02092 [Drechmeria coniospora]
MKCAGALFFAAVASAGTADGRDFPEAVVVRAISSTLQSFRSQIEHSDSLALANNSTLALADSAEVVLQTLRRGLFTVAITAVPLEEEAARVAADGLPSVPRLFASLQGPLRNKRAALAAAGACGGIRDFLDDCTRLATDMFRSLAWRMPAGRSRAAVESCHDELDKVMKELMADFLDDKCHDGPPARWRWMPDVADGHLLEMHAEG